MPGLMQFAGSDRPGSTPPWPAAVAGTSSAAWPAALGKQLVERQLAPLAASESKTGTLERRAGCSRNVVMLSDVMAAGCLPSSGVGEVMKRLSEGRSPVKQE